MLLPGVAVTAGLTIGLVLALALGVLNRTMHRIEVLLQDQGVEQRVARSTDQMQAITLRQLNHNVALATGLPEWQNHPGVPALDQWSSGPLPVYTGTQQTPPQGDDDACGRPPTPPAP
jgi:hypothetical protein